MIIWIDVSQLTPTMRIWCRKKKDNMNFFLTKIFRNGWCCNLFNQSKHFINTSVIHQKQLGDRYLAQGHFNMRTGGAGDQITDPPIRGWHALPHEPMSPLEWKYIDKDNCLTFFFSFLLFFFCHALIALSCLEYKLRRSLLKNYSKDCNILISFVLSCCCQLIFTCG